MENYATMYDIPKLITAASFCNDQVSIHQFEYPSALYKSELIQHNKSLTEYDDDIYESLIESLELNKPNIDLYKQQPYLTFSIRLKLIDFLLKMSIRLKILPFVFFKAVKIFDRYCSKRIVLLDQSQLIITTCLWIASKLQGGNNHFINLNNLDKLNTIRTINDLGYGSGGKYKGPTERFRLPKLHELVKLCGAKCKYDQGMFKQMELHVLSTLEWNFNDPSIEEFITYSHEFNILKENEFFKIKEFLSYVSLYSNELIDTNTIELSKVIVDLVNEVLNLTPSDYFYQRINYNEDVVIEASKYSSIKKSLVKAILNASEFILKLFNSKGPQQFFFALSNIYKDPYSPVSRSTLPYNNQYTPVHPHHATQFSTPNPTPPCTSSSFTSSSVSVSSYGFQSPASTPPTASGSSPQHVFKPVVSSNLLKYTSASPLDYYSIPHPHYNYKSSNLHHHFPHQNNASQSSLSSTMSRDHDYNSIFEYDPRRYGVSTPLSDEESPMLPLVKPNIESH